ncbi:hypothetical protein [Borreliella valaisiana]|uniref:hypothetical protein n=1 Tax=Borreliella valaisiana TaxID=62088 RepID=UPI003B9F9475
MYNRCFVDFGFKVNKINITVTPSQVTLKEDSTRAVSNIGKLGNGDTQIFLYRKF